MNAVFVMVQASIGIMVFVIVKVIQLMKMAYVVTNNLNLNH